MKGSLRPIRVLVLDDHEIVRAGLKALLADEPDIELVALARSIREALHLFKALEPDVVLMESTLRDGTGAEVCAAMLRQRPNTAVIILTGVVDDDAVHEGLRAGARGFLTKDLPASELPHAIRTVARGDAVLAPGVTARVIEWAREAKSVHRAGQDLTPREAQILRLISSGLTNGEVASELNMNTHTVRWYARRIKQKMGARGRVEAVSEAIQRGVI